MADSIVRLRVDSQEYDNKLKRATEGLRRYVDGCRKAGGTLEYVDDGVKEFAKSLGNMDTVATTSKGKLNEMTSAFTEMKMAFNSMTDAEKKGDFGRALSASLDQMRQKIIDTRSQLQGINQSLSGGTPAANVGGLFGGGKLDGMLQVFGGNLMTKGAGMLAGLASEMGDMIKQGIELAKQGEGIRMAFQRLGRGDILDGLRQATHGTVTDIELMKAAVQFSDFKLPLDELGTMLAFAQQKAKDTGQSVDYMVSSIVTGLGRKSLMILDNLGLSAAEIKEKMKDTGDMTKAVGAIIRDQMAKAGDYVETAADRANQANVQLQNKMEELGRKFAPLEQASNNLWTSMKLGIMDIIGGPLTTFLNKLTEAGRLAQQYGVLGGSTKVGRMVGNLANTREDRRQSVYQRQQSEIWKLINPREQQLKDIRAWQRGDRGEALQGRINAITQKYGSLDATKIQAEIDAYKKVLADYQQAVKPLLTPIKPEVDTTKAEQSVDSLKVKLIELQAQRKKAIAAGDTDLSKKRKTQISQLKADIKELGGIVPGTTTTHQTPAQKAQETFTKAEQNYKQAMEQAAMELQAGTINQAQAKQKEMQAAEARWKAIGDARNIADSPKLQQAQVEAADTYQKLAAEVKTATERQKAIDKATRDLENANQKLADARSEMAAAEKSGDRKAYYAAEKKATTAQQEVTRLETVKVNVEQGRVQLPDVPTEDKTIRVNIEATTSNLDAEIANMKDKMSQLAVGSDVFNLDLAKMVDFTTLRTLINEKVKNGLTIDPEASQNLMNQIINGENITDEAWQKLVDEINKKLKELGIDPISINLKTGDADGKKGRGKRNPYLQYNEDGSTQASVKGIFDGLAHGMSQMVSGMEQLGIDVPEEIKGVISIMQGISAILTGIATTVLAIQALTAADTFIPFAHGGVVHAAGGWVGGNNMSGDRVPALLNSGELVLNRFQQETLAANLRDGGLQGLYLEASVHAEQIRLALNNNGKRTGRGELVTWKRS